MDKVYDILIVGGGMVGSSLACALLPAGWHIGIVEAHPLPTTDQDTHPTTNTSIPKPTTGYDDRSVALSYGSRILLQQLGLWTHLAPSLSPIHRIHVSDQGHFGCVRLNCQEEGLDALGYVASGTLMGQVLSQHLASQDTVDYLTNAQVMKLQPGYGTLQVQIEQAGVRQAVCTRLLVAADGANSTVRRLLDIMVRQWRYGQAAVIANIKPRLGHHQTAYERFTATGPLALLPLTQGWCGMIQTVPENQAEARCQASDADFLQALQHQFGWRLGQLDQVTRRKFFPLSLLQAKERIRPRVVLLGNAAHTLHPVAGQGFNLGLRDVATLAEGLLKCAKQGRDPGDPELLRNYDRQRRGDQNRVIAFTDGLVRLFSNPLVGVGVVRTLGMLGLGRLPSFRHQLARHAMGLAGRMPRLDFTKEQTK